MSETKIPRITTYEGKDIRTMTRDELIEALERTGDLLASCYTPGSIRARALGQVVMIKRG